MVSEASVTDIGPGEVVVEGSGVISSMTMPAMQLATAQKRRVATITRFVRAASTNSAIKSMDIMLRVVTPTHFVVSG